MVEYFYLSKNGQKITCKVEQIFAQTDNSIPVKSTLITHSDMEFVQNFIPPDFLAKNFTPLISPNFNSFSKKKHKN